MISSRNIASRCDSWWWGCFNSFNCCGPSSVVQDNEIKVNPHKKPFPKNVPILNEPSASRLGFPKPTERTSVSEDYPLPPTPEENKEKKLDLTSEYSKCNHHHGSKCSHSHHDDHLRRFSIRSESNVEGILKVQAQGTHKPQKVSCSSGCCDQPHSETKSVKEGPQLSQKLAAPVCSEPCCHSVGQLVKACSHSTHSHSFPSKLNSDIVKQLDGYLIKSPSPSCHEKSIFERLINKFMPSTAGSCRSCGQAAQTIGLSSDEMASTQNVRAQDNVGGHAETGAEHIADTAVSAGVGLLGAVGALFSLKMLWSTRKEAKNIARVANQHQTLKTTQRRFLRLKQAGLVLGIAAGSLVATASVASIVGATWPGFVVMGSVGLVCAVGMVGTHIASQAYRYYSVQQNQKLLPIDSQYAYQDQKNQAVLGGAVGTVFAGTIIASAVVASPVVVPVLAVALCAHALCNTSMQSATSHKSNTMDLLTDSQHLANQKTRHEVLTSMGFIKVGYIANAIDYLRWGGGKTWQWLKSWVDPTAEPYVVVRARQVLSHPQNIELMNSLIDPESITTDSYISQEQQLARAYEHYYYVNPSVTDIVYGRQAGELYQS